MDSVDVAADRNGNGLGYVAVYCGGELIEDGSGGELSCCVGPEFFPCAEDVEGFEPGGNGVEAYGRESVSGICWVVEVADYAFVPVPGGGLGKAEAIQEQSFAGSAGADYEADAIVFRYRGENWGLEGGGSVKLDVELLGEVLGGAV